MNGTNNRALLLLAAMFLIVGAMFCMNDILFPSLIKLFNLSYTAATAIQMSFYSVYLIFPIPVAIMIDKKGYRFSIIAAVIICALGCLFFLPAYLLTSFWLCLLGIFTLSIGIVIMNVAANAYATLLGDPEGAERRINFVQAFSRVGYAIVPVLATKMIYQGSEVRFHFPYLAIMLALILIAVLMMLSDMPTMKNEAVENFNLRAMFTESTFHKHLFWGIFAMFFYVGAEASIAGFFISYLKTVNHFSDDGAATYLTLYNIMATVMGFLAIVILRYTKGYKLVTWFGCGIIGLFGVIVSTNNPYNGILLIAIGGLLGPMFPTIFGLAIDQLKDFTNKGAALISLAISGGAFFAPLQGVIADRFGIQYSYVVPLFCFIMIVIYSLSYKFLKKSNKTVIVI